MSTCKVLQVSNISPSSSKEQIQALFSYLGRIEECRVYPSDNTSQKPKFAYIKFEREKSVDVGQHLTNTVFIDRALICVPAQSNTIPDEDIALQMGGPALPGQRTLPPNVTNQEQDVGDGQMMLFTNDPNLTQLGLPQYPPLPANTEPSKVEEIRRTVYIGNLSKDYDGEELLQFLTTTIGEVMYLRMAAGNDNLPCSYAYVEFSNQSSVPLALQNNGIEYNGRCLRIQHSRVAIIKPQRKTAEQSLEEVEEAIKTNEGRGEKAGSIGRGYSPIRKSISPNRHKSRYSRSPKRKRSRSRERRSRSPRDRRSKSKERERRREREEKRSKRSHSRDHKKSSVRDKDREREKERDRVERKRDRDSDRSSKREKDRLSRKRSRSVTPSKKSHRKSSKRDSSVDETPEKKKPPPPSTSDDESEDQQLSKKSSKKERDDVEIPKKKYVSSKLEHEEESLRERLLERVKRKNNSGDN